MVLNIYFQQRLVKTKNFPERMQKKLPGHWRFLNEEYLLESRNLATNRQIFVRQEFHTEHVLGLACHSQPYL